MSVSQIAFLVWLQLPEARENAADCGIIWGRAWVLEEVARVSRHACDECCAVFAWICASIRAQITSQPQAPLSIESVA